MANLQVVRVLVDEPLDEVDLLQGDLHRVLVLGAARRVRDPELEGSRKERRRINCDFFANFGDPDRDC